MILLALPCFLGPPPSPSPSSAMEVLEGRLHAWSLALAILFFSLLAPIAEGEQVSKLLVRRRHAIKSRRAVAEVIRQSQVWCVASASASDSALQAGLDWACDPGRGNADCSAIQPSGSCYTPQNVQNHASYAYNQYYQKENQVPTACNFSGTATVTSTNPSSGSCIYLSSSSGLTLNSTTPSASSPTTIFNPNSSHASHLLRPPAFFYNSPHALCGMLVALLMCMGA